MDASTSSDKALDNVTAPSQDAQAEATRCESRTRSPGRTKLTLESDSKRTARVLLPEDDGSHQLNLTKATPSPAPVRAGDADDAEEDTDEEGGDEEDNGAVSHGLPQDADFLSEFPDETDVRDAS